MVPTMFGRIQTRLLLLAIVGGLVTAAITPVLPVGGPLSQRYQATFLVLASVAVIGVAWEFVYHFVMQWRWEKDWPTLFGLLTLVPEGVLVGALAHGRNLPGLPGAVPAAAFAIQFLVVWIFVWIVANGPMRVPNIRWRFRGGRVM
jgi:hypothetical protein